MDTLLLSSSWGSNSFFEICSLIGFPHLQLCLGSKNGEREGDGGYVADVAARVHFQPVITAHLFFRPPKYLHR